MTSLPRHHGNFDFPAISFLIRGHVCIRTVLIMKRGRKDQLTGGSGDVNMQSVLFPLVTQTAADTTTIRSLQLPIPRLPTRPGYNLVLEVLSAEFSFILAGVAAAVQSIYAYVATTGETPPNITQALLGTRVICDAWFQFVFAAGGSGDLPTEKDVQLTDQAGHGRLIASDTIFLGLMSTNTAAANNVVCKLWYRWKEVTLTEYIGIVQSQQ